MSLMTILLYTVVETKSYKITYLQKRLTVKFRWVYMYQCIYILLIEIHTIC